MIPDRTPAAFICRPPPSERPGGRIPAAQDAVTRLCDGLVEEVRVQSGDDTFDAFVGEGSVLIWTEWLERVRDGLENATFLLVLVQPLLFRSPECRVKLQEFRAAEARARRDDLVVPVLWSETPGYPQGGDDPLLAWLATRPIVDWRARRHLRSSDPAWVAGVSELAAVFKRSLAAARVRGALPRLTPPCTAAAAGPGQGWQALEGFLRAAFSVSELRRVLRWNLPAVADGIPPGVSSPATCIAAAIEALQVQDAVGPPLWEALLAERPRRRAEIEAVRACFGA